MMLPIGPKLHAKVNCQPLDSAIMTPICAGEASGALTVVDGQKNQNRNRGQADPDNPFDKTRERFLLRSDIHFAVNVICHDLLLHLIRSPATFT